MGIGYKSCSLDGVWSGCFYFDETAQEGVTFSAWITLTNGRITGSSLEPNTFVDQDRDELEANLSGHLDGEEIIFLKSYHGLDQEPVYCEGSVCPEGEKISGKWYFNWPQEISGTFEMERKRAKTRARQTVSPNTPT